MSSGYNVTKFLTVPSSVCTWYLFRRSECLLVIFVLTRPQYLAYKAMFNPMGMTRLKRIYEYERNLCRYAGFQNEKQVFNVLLTVYHLDVIS
jgi:hypothetical protein